MRLLDGAARFAVDGVSAAALLEAMSPDFAAAEPAPKADSRIVATTIDFLSPQGYGIGRRFLVRPAARRGRVVRRRRPGPAGGARHRREPGPQSTHRGHFPAPCGRRLHPFAPDALSPTFYSASSTRPRRARTCSPPRYLKGVPGDNGKIGVGVEGRGQAASTRFAIRDTQHGFKNDPTPRFNAAADQAWQRTVAFFHRTLRG